MGHSMKKQRWICLAAIWLCFFLVCMSNDTQAASGKKVLEAFGKSISTLTRKNPPQMVNGIQSTSPYATKRLIVKVRKGNVIWKKYGPTSVVKGPYGVWVLQFKSIQATKRAANKIKKLKNISYVEPDRVVGVTSVSSDGTSGASKYTALGWGVDAAGLADFAQYVSTKTSNSIKVAVVDTGIADNSFLKTRLIKGKDVYGWSRSTKDLDGHGTHVAGIIADSTPGLNVRILPIRISEDRDQVETDIGIGIMYAVELGAKVINLSLGNEGKMAFVEEMIDKAVNKGCVVVVSSGNGSVDINKKYISPAYMKNVITVGAVDAVNHLAYFSNFGKSLDVVAPGMGIESTWIDGSKDHAEDGTSMSAPYVSALAAMYCLLYPDKTPAQIKKLITGSAKDLGKKGWDKYYGYGLIQAPTVYTQLKLKETNAALAIGETKKLNYTLKNRFLKSGHVVWTTSNADVVSVKNGEVTGKKTGKATVTVTAYGKSASCEITVKNYTLKGKAFRTYAEALKKGTGFYGDDVHMAYFALPDLDGNGIPELITSDSAQNCNSLTIYGVNGVIQDMYSLYDVSTDNHSINAWQYPGNGVFYTTRVETSAVMALRSDTGNENPKNSDTGTGRTLNSILNYQYAYLLRGAERMVQYPDFPLTKSEWTYSGGIIDTIYQCIGLNKKTEKISEKTFHTMLKRYVGNDEKAVSVLFIRNNAMNRKALE